MKFKNSIKKYIRLILIFDIGFFSNFKKLDGNEEQGEEKNEEIIEDQKKKELFKFLGFFIFLPLVLSSFFFYILLYNYDRAHRLLYISLFWFLSSSFFISLIYYNEIIDNSSPDKLIEILKKKSRTIIYSISSVSFLIGISIQFVYLEDIDALRFFSRGQVLNDGILIILILVFFLILIFFLWVFFFSLIRFFFKKNGGYSIPIVLIFFSFFLINHFSLLDRDIYRENFYIALLDSFYVFFYSLLLIFLIFFVFICVNKFLSERKEKPKFRFLLVFEIILIVGWVLFIFFSERLEIENKRDLSPVFKKINIEKNVFNDAEECIEDKVGILPSKILDDFKRQFSGENGKIFIKKNELPDNLNGFFSGGNYQKWISKSKFLNKLKKQLSGFPNKLHVSRFKLSNELQEKYPGKNHIKKYKLYYKNNQYTFLKFSQPNDYDEECILIIPNSKINYYKEF